MTTGARQMINPYIIYLKYSLMGCNGLFMTIWHAFFLKVLNRNIFETFFEIEIIVLKNILFSIKNWLSKKIEAVCF